MVCNSSIRFEDFPRGAITEITGSRSSGKTGFLLSMLARTTAKGEFAAIIDPVDSFDPLSAETAGIDFSRLLWIRCSGNVDSALKSADYLLHAGGFGVVAIDLADVRPEIVSRIPQSFWFRFRLTIEKTRTSFLLISPVHCAGASCSTSLHFNWQKVEWSGSPEHKLLKGIHNKVLIRKEPGMLRAGRNRAAGHLASTKTANPNFGQ